MKYIFREGFHNILHGLLCVSIKLGSNTSTAVNEREREMFLECTGEQALHPLPYYDRAFCNEWNHLIVGFFLVLNIQDMVYIMP